VNPRILTIRQCGSNGGYPQYAIAQYVARWTADGRRAIWTLDGNIQTYNRSVVRAHKELPTLAVAMGLPWALGVRQNQELGL
jgi:hypothetical protein